MNVFSLDRHLIREYASFARSFTKIRAHDIAEQVEHIYARCLQLFLRLREAVEREFPVGAMGKHQST